MTRASLCLALLLAACAGGPVSVDPAVTLAEFSIAFDGNLVAGSQTVSVRNEGEFSHTLVVSALRGEVVAASDIISPGDSADLDLDLDAGQYRFTCRIVVETDTGEIIDHYARGMAADVGVQ